MFTQYKNEWHDFTSCNKEPVKIIDTHKGNATQNRQASMSSRTFYDENNKLIYYKYWTIYQRQKQKHGKLIIYYPYTGNLIS